MRSSAVDPHPDTQRPGPHPRAAVVGAGPVGLAATVLLAGYGVGVDLFEQNPATSDAAKAISLDAESIRTFGMADIADDILRVVVPGTGTAYFGARDQLLFHAGARIPAQFGYPVKNQFSQPELERVLLAAAIGHPHVAIHFSTKVTNVTMDSDTVALDIDDGPGVTRREYAYVLGCDGGRSTVRSVLGIDMTGRNHSERWLVLDLKNDDHRQRYGMHHGDPKRPHVIIPGRDGRCRYEFRLVDEDLAPGETVPFDLIRDLVARYRSVIPDDVERAVCYTFNSLVADRWRDGRAFLLGDAAHMMPPFAGQGLNSGIRDAANLCWKLAAVLAGRATDALLDTYETERRRHAEATVRLSRRLGNIVMTTSPPRAVIRDWTVAVMRLHPRSHTFLTEMRYRPSSRLRIGFLDRASKDPLVGTVLDQPRVLLDDGYSVALLDRVLGPGFSLLGISVPPGAWDAATSLIEKFDAAAIDVCLDDLLPGASPSRSAVGDVDGRLQRYLEHHRGTFVLVRPDRYVCAVTAADDIPALLNRLESYVPSRGLRRIGSDRLNPTN